MPTPFMAALEQRSTTQTVRHVVTNVEVTALDVDRAKSILYVTAYQHDTGEQATAPPVIRSPSLLLVVPGELVRTEERLANFQPDDDARFRIPACESAGKHLT